MLRETPTLVKLPFQALVDNELLGAERLTLALLYAYADADGVVNETCDSLQAPRQLHKNSVRRHLYKLERLRYLVPHHREEKHDRVLKRKVAERYALTLAPNGERWPAWTEASRIGSRTWEPKARRG